MTNRFTTKLTVGASAPFSLIHISDTHLTLCDERNDKRKQDLAAGRRPAFALAESRLAEAEAYHKETGFPIVHTGDLTDFVSEANLERAGKFTSENDVLFAAGNHEFSLYVGEAFEDEAYREQSLAHVQSFFTNDIRFTSRKLNGVNLIAIDNSYYRFDKPQLDALKAEVALGLPIILFMHDPLFEPKLYDFQRTKSDSAYLVSTPVELMKDYNDYRYRQQLADAITLEATEYIESCPLVKAIFCGHLHYRWDGELECGIPQYVTGTPDIRTIEIE